MQFRILRNIDSGPYFPGPYNSEYLMTLSYVFTDGIGFTDNITSDLQNLDSQGRYGNVTDVYIEKDTVNIHADYGIDSITEPIKINRYELLRIVGEGLALMKKQVPYIILMRENENEPILVTDIVPEGMQLEFKNKRLYAYYKGKTF